MPDDALKPGLWRVRRDRGVRVGAVKSGPARAGQSPARWYCVYTHPALVDSSVVGHHSPRQDIDTSLDVAGTIVIRTVRIDG